MSDMNLIINELKEIAKDPAGSVKKTMQETGKKAVGCFPIYTPEEVVYAAGAVPVGMWGGQVRGNLSAKYLQTFCCSIMQANTEQALLGHYDNLSAVIIPTYCDTLKCIAENWKVASPQLNVIPMVYPQNRKTAEGKVFIKEEFTRVKEILEGILGVKVTDEALEESVNLYDQYRAEMQKFVDLVSRNTDVIDATTRHLIIKAAYFMDKKVYTDKIALINKALEERTAPERDEVRVILTGLMAEPDSMLDIFAENNISVVADDLAQESRQFRTIAPAEGTALDRMAERIAMQDGCAFLYDEKKTRGQMLIDMKEKYKADAVVVCQLKFCDPEEFDYPILKKELEAAKIPMLYLEIEQQMDSVEQLRTRIQSFSEII